MSIVKVRDIKKVVVFNGSPRKNSRTIKYLNSFLHHFEGKAEIIQYKLFDYNIKYCLGCKHCWRNEGECVHDDDMIKLIHDYNTADLLIFATPLYVGSVSGIIKTFIDRTIATVTPAVVKGTGVNSELRNKRLFKRDTDQYVLSFSTGGLGDNDSNFKGVDATIEAIDRHNEHMLYIGGIFITYSYALENMSYEMLNNIIHTNLKNMGKKFIEDNIFDKSLLSGISKKINDALFIRDSKHYWKW